MLGSAIHSLICERFPADWGRPDSGDLPVQKIQVEIILGSMAQLAALLPGPAHSSSSLLHLTGSPRWSGSNAACGVLSLISVLAQDKIS